MNCYANSNTTLRNILAMTIDNEARSNAKLYKYFKFYDCSFNDTEGIVTKYYQFIFNQRVGFVLRRFKHVCLHIGGQPT